MSIKLVIQKPVLDSMLNSTKGELGMSLSKLGDKIVMSARMQVGRKTGRLARSIRKRHLANFNGQYLWIGSDLPYALAHHDGTRPHVITPKESDGKLVFFKGTKMIVTRRVMHPGTRPNKYLLNPLIRHIYTL